MYTQTHTNTYSLSLLHACMDMCAIAEWSTLSASVGPFSLFLYLNVNLAGVWKEYSFWGYVPEIAVMNTIMWTRNAIQGGGFFFSSFKIFVFLSIAAWVLLIVVILHFTLHVLGPEQCSAEDQFLYRPSIVVDRFWCPVSLHYISYLISVKFNVTYT